VRVAGWCRDDQAAYCGSERGVGADVPGRLTRSRIAALTRAPAATIGYHLSVALAADPGLQAAHEKAPAHRHHK
jgi:hypothetical protein